MYKDHVVYLSKRVSILLLSMMAVALFLLLALLIDGLDLFSCAMVAVLMLGVIGVVFWKWVYCPYRHIEKFSERALEGYMTEQERADINHALSPVSRLLLQRLWEIQNPSHIFQMNKRQAQYLALQNQINPHFLYNTLESIRSEALVSDIPSIADMTEALATFFRYTISKVENLVSVEEELQNCRVYFRIQQYRFGERLNLHVLYDPADEEEILRCRLPKLSMQPLLENAIIHGTELKLEQGNLTIALELTKKRLVIRISDDGVGMDEATLAKLNGKFGNRIGAPNPTEERKGGLALVNVDERIRLLFGEEYGLHVFSQQGVGTDVELNLPAVTSDREVQNREVLQ